VSRGAVTQAEAREQAVERVREAIELYVEDLAALAEPIPGA
jgi:predicted RNase H-like HicB family nuclease